MDVTTRIDGQALMRRVMWRIMPVVTLLYLAAIIDRSNVGFAKLQMVSALHMSETAYGLGSSLFFIGYLIFEIPSVLALHRFGARAWLTRIIGTWGLITVILAFSSTPAMFYGLRFVLGVAEAGAYPGIIFYLTLWLPQEYRVRGMAILTLGSAFGNMLGALIGGPLLDLDGVLGLAGWQWVFVATGVPAVALAFVTFAFLPNGPRQSRFLTTLEADWLGGELAREAPPQRAHGSLLSVLWDSQVLALSFVYTLILISLYGVIYWLPTVVKGFGVTGTTNGLLTSIPWLVAAIGLIYVPRRLKTEPAVLGAMTAIAGIGLLCFLASVLLPGNALRFVALAFGTPCISLLLPCFWSLPARHFQGARAAAAIAAISSFGNLGGFLAQNLMPWVAQQLGSPVMAMLVPAVCLAGLGLCAAAMRRTPRLLVPSQA